MDSARSENYEDLTTAEMKTKNYLEHRDEAQLTSEAAIEAAARLF